MFRGGGPSGSCQPGPGSIGCPVVASRTPPCCGCPSAPGRASRSAVSRCRSPNWPGLPDRRCSRRPAPPDRHHRRPPRRRPRLPGRVRRPTRRPRQRTPQHPRRNQPTCDAATTTQAGRHDDTTTPQALWRWEQSARGLHGPALTGFALGLPPAAPGEAWEDFDTTTGELATDTAITSSLSEPDTGDDALDDEPVDHRRQQLTVRRARRHWVHGYADHARRENRERLRHPTTAAPIGVVGAVLAGRHPAQPGLLHRRELGRRRRDPRPAPRRAPHQPCRRPWRPARTGSTRPSPWPRSRSPASVTAPAPARPPRPRSPPAASKTPPVHCSPPTSPPGAARRILSVPGHPRRSAAATGGRHRPSSDAWLHQPLHRAAQLAETRGWDHTEASPYVLDVTGRLGNPAEAAATPPRWLRRPARRRRPLHHPRPPRHRDLGAARPLHHPIARHKRTWEHYSHPTIDPILASWTRRRTRPLPPVPRRHPPPHPRRGRLALHPRHPAVGSSVAA